MLQLLHLDYPRLLLSFVLLFSLTIIQLKYQIDERCDLKYLYETKTEKKLDSLCQLSSYLILNLQNIITFNCFYCIICELPICLYQFSKKLVIQKICVMLTILQSSIDCIFQVIGDYKIMSELQILIVLVAFFWVFMSKHSLGVQM